ncbi:MAG TPA: EAL domain-containing protein [Usitatibacter sp.]|nr:EAL domain-containing protein [Usitatibacter sp.]
MSRSSRARQRGHVARRLFLLFILSAFLPLALIAALSLGEVRSLLLQQGEQRLAATAKTYGMTVYERLLVASDVAISTAQRTTFGAAHDDLAHRTFVWITQLEPDGTARALIGRGSAPALGEDALRRLSERKPAILVARTQDVTHVILAVAKPGAERGSVVVGEVNPEYLWGSPDELPAMTDFCIVEDISGDTLHCTTPLSPEAERAMIASRASHLGTATWQRDGEAWRGIAWPQFMRAGFGTRDWVVIASQPERFQVERATQFGRLYVPVVVLALLLVGWLTIRQASHIVKPLEVLAKRARGLAQNDFGSQVEMAPREDEFGELAAAFDTMSQKLGRQFASLKALSDIDRLILSTVDSAQVIRTVLHRLGSAVRADAVSVTLLEHDNADYARTYSRAAEGEEGLRMTRHEISPAERGELEGASAGQWLKLEGAVPRYLESLTTEAATTAYVQPVVWRGTLCGALALGYRRTSSLDPEERQHALELADRVAVAVSSAWRDEQLYLQAHFDPLTGLPNRLLFKDRLGQEIARSQREGLRFGLLFVDLDHFKTVNDSFGHTTGDAVLRETARRISRCVRTTDTVSRLGGDEFTVMLTNLHHAQEAWVIAESAVEALSREYHVNGEHCFLSASVGIASFPEDGASAEELLKSADTAMYRAKANGRSQAVYFEERMNAEAVARLTLDRDLRVAIERGELELHYQPKLDLATDVIVGAEALVRWRHPVHGLISPERFIPLAEESGFIEQVGHWTLAEACAQMRRWRDAALPLESVSVNVSPRQFRRRGLLEFIRECVTEAGLPPACLGIEITEGLLMERSQSIEDLLQRLSAMGHPIALDDFGTGFSSMAYLNRFPVREIKIDRLFIEGLAPGVDSEAIVAAIIAMSHALGKVVVAEGVEKPEQLELLERMGCDQVQGFLLSEAVPAAQFEARVRGRVAAAASLA